MGENELVSPIVFHVFGVPVREVVVTTWSLGALLVVASAIGTRRLRERPRFLQSALEVAAEAIEHMVRETTPRTVESLVPFVGTLALFLFGSALLALVPGVRAPTSDLGTALALAIVVFLSVHVYGIRVNGTRRYLARYLQPVWLLLPFNVIGEITRTIALALRLFGNMLSGELMVAIVLLLAGFLVPVPLQLFGLLIALIQAYVFTLLTIVFLTAGLHESSRTPDTAS